MDAWQVAVLALVALFVGIMIPVLLQARSSMRELSSRLAATSDKLGPVLDDANVIAHRLSVLSEGLEGREQKVVEVVDAAADVAATIKRLQGTTRAATMMGAALAAAVRAYRDVQTAAAEVEFEGGIGEQAGEPAKGAPSPNGSPAQTDGQTRAAGPE
jgi:uncharacterized protein YoxC